LPSSFGGEGEVFGGAVGRGGGNETTTESRSCSSAQDRPTNQPTNRIVDIINERECQGSIHGMNAFRRFNTTIAGSSMTETSVVVIVY